MSKNTFPLLIKDIERKVLQRIDQQYQQKDERPWVIAYSGGKDSTLVLHLVVKYLLSLKKYKRMIYVVCNNTLVESPFVMSLAEEYISKFRAFMQKNKIPMKFTITQPENSDTFWVNIIGRGYPPPSRVFRWCVDRLKIRPTNSYIKKIISETGDVVLLLGSRFDESQTRSKSISKHLTDHSNFISKHASLENCSIFMPIADIAVDDLWEMIAAFRTPWGEHYSRLIQLYKDALGGECPVVLSKDDTPACGNKSARFGCWTCSVVKKDRSLEGLDNADNNFRFLINFRNWLIKFSQQPQNRYPFSRQGNIRRRKDGSIIPGSLTLSARKKIYYALEQLGNDANMRFLSDSEMSVIKNEWKNAEGLEEMMKHNIAGLCNQMIVKMRH